MPTDISSICSLNLPFPPSCAAFSPAYPHYIVVGTYELERQGGNGGENSQVAVDAAAAVAISTAVDATTSTSTDERGEEKQQQKRNGSLVVLRVEGDEISPIQSVLTPSAVFDLHFHPHTETQPNLLAAVTSTGSLCLYRLVAPAFSEIPQLQHIQTLQLLPETTLITYFTWHPSVAGRLALTLSDGQVKLFQLHFPLQSIEQGTPFTFEEYTGSSELVTHDLEAWVVAFSPTGNVLFSGGDDSVLVSNAVASLESEKDDEIAKSLIGGQATWSTRKMHDAGVTAILPLSEHIILTGSYDDCIRVISLPPIGPKRVIAEQNLGGGVWRLQTIYADMIGLNSAADTSVGKEAWSCVLLVCCMHAGARIVEIAYQEGECKIEVLAQFEEHKSMCYASDIVPGNFERGMERTIVSTSFYDQLVCLWRYQV